MITTNYDKNALKKRRKKKERKTSLLPKIESESLA